jgi:DNA-binding transcriptional regulator YdaS (Cro superfamily)
MTPKKVLAKVYKKMLTKTNLATQLGISRQAVSKWVSVPVHHVITIESLTGISRHELRPDIYPID